MPDPKKEKRRAVAYSGSRKEYANELRKAYAPKADSASVMKNKDFQHDVTYYKKSDSLLHSAKKVKKSASGKAADYARSASAFARTKMDPSYGYSKPVPAHKKRIDGIKAKLKGLKY